MASLSEKSLTAFIWVGIDKLGGSSVNFSVTIILARLLLPEDFGLVAMVMILFDFSSVFVESGFSIALIREKTISEKDKSTIFIFNFIAAVFFFLIFFFCAPLIASFFEQEALTWIIRIMALNLVINALGIIHYATLSQTIDFGTQTKVRFLSIIISGVIAISMAMNGFGVWSLVAKAIVMALANTIFIWLANPWKPSLNFSRESFRRLFGFSSKILFIVVIEKFYSNLFQVLIGKFFSVATLGYYKQSDNFRSIFTTTLLQTLQRVTYPVMAKLQDDAAKLKDGFRRMIKMSSFIMMPAMVLLGVLAKPFIVTLVGVKWLPSVLFLQLLCAGGLLYHISSLNNNIILALGKANLCLKLEIINKPVIIAVIIAGIQFGIIGLVVAQVIASYVELITTTYFSNKLLNYSLLNQIMDTMSSLVFSMLAGGVVYLIIHFVTPPGITSLIAGSACGAFLYLLFHFLANTAEMQLLREMIIPRTVSFITSFR